MTAGEGYLRLARSLARDDSERPWESHGPAAATSPAFHRRFGAHACWLLLCSPHHPDSSRIPGGRVHIWTVWPYLPPVPVPVHLGRRSTDRPVREMHRRLLRTTDCRPGCGANSPVADTVSCRRGPACCRRHRSLATVVHTHREHLACAACIWSRRRDRSVPVPVSFPRWFKQQGGTR